MNEAKDKVLALNVRLKSSDLSAHPRATNHTNVGVAEGIAYLDFGFIEPSLIGAVANSAKNGQAAPKGIDGQLVSRLGRTFSTTSTASASVGRRTRCVKAEAEL